MKNTVDKFNELVETFKTDVNSQLDKANKAAGARARKLSLEMEKLLKEFRKKSLDKSKE